MDLLAKRHVSLPQGEIAYLELGPAEAPPLLLVHGIPTSSQLWRRVMRDLASEFRCLAPDLMGLGDTRCDPHGDCYGMDAQARMLADFMDAKGCPRFGLICHDQGGAAAQLLATTHPERIRCFVLTNCVCYDNWPVPAVAWLQALMRLPLLPSALIRARVFHLREQRSPWSAFRRGVHDPSHLSNAMIAEYLRPLLASRTSRRRFMRFILAGDPRHSLRAAEGLRHFEAPALVLWAADDRYISPSWGLRLHEDIPGSQGFELIPFCGHFWQEERPEAFLAHMRPFLRHHATKAAEPNED